MVTVVVTFVVTVVVTVVVVAVVVVAVVVTGVAGGGCYLTMVVPPWPGGSLDRRGGLFPIGGGPMWGWGYT